MRISHSITQTTLSTMPPSSPVPHEAQHEWPTPIRAKIRSDRFDHAMTYEAISNTRSVPVPTVSTICHAPISRRGVNYIKTTETRGRKSKVTSKDIRQLEKILEEDGFCARALTWEQLGYEANWDVSGNTIRRAMGTMEYHKCLALGK